MTDPHVICSCGHERQEHNEGGCGVLVGSWSDGVCPCREFTARDYPERSPGFVLGYLEGWNDAKAGRQYGEGRHGQRSGLVGQDSHEGCRAATRAKVAMYEDWLREHHPDCPLLAENIVGPSESSDG